jgi:hypothetical protein
MKLRIIVAILFVQPLFSAEEVVEYRIPKPLSAPVSAPQGWLGLQVAKPDANLTAQLPALPKGIGFVVMSTDEGGPAQAAGLLQSDVLWKMGDQLLVNEGQLSTLLRLNEPGQEVTLSGFRGGKPLEVKLKLGENPNLKKTVPDELIEASILPDVYAGPMRVVNLVEKSVSYSADSERAEVRREGQEYLVKIEGQEGKTLFDGKLIRGDTRLDGVPENWHQRIQVLCRTLDLAIDGGMNLQRQPRPRVVPPAVGQPRSRVVPLVPPAAQNP